MAKVAQVLPANRIAALATFLAGLGGCATSLAGVWPSSATTEIALIGGSLATIAGPLAHVIGSWLWDRNAAQIGVAKAYSAVDPNGPDPQAGLSPDPPGTVPDIPDPPQEWNPPDPPAQ